IRRATREVGVVGVMDMSFSMGSEGAVGMDLRAKSCNLKDGPLVLDFIAGLGGREVSKETIRHIVARCRTVASAGQPEMESYWVHLDRTLLP
ncbi:MAG: hypothetical protein ACE5LD_02725, partial [Candidatus Bipolaricaulia bacterium]